MAHMGLFIDLSPHVHTIKDVIDLPERCLELGSLGYEPEEVKLKVS